MRWAWPFWQQTMAEQDSAHAVEASINGSEPFTAPDAYRSAEIAGQYDSRRFGNPYGRLRSRLQHRALERCLSDLPPISSVLEVAAGTGRLTEVLVARYGNVTGSDISPEMLAAAKRRLGGQIKLQVADARALPFPDSSFDLVAAFFLLGHAPVPVRHTILTELQRVSKACVVVSVPAIDYALPRYWRRATRQQSPFRPFYPATRTQFEREFSAAGLERTRWVPSLKLASGTWFAVSRKRAE